ncbi:hypothetical protein PhaeoP75_01785 [Phaeobacter gallaeciensis]|uniref:Uncharacterized protein n=1 Tax=Phaeobacter gallaeciensis TaxID=60890 RepID=A0AAD0ECT5_9RHOB|nr:hypothetical protein Gal_01744 [Phaeobacter gallaeciensis DSM 26640]ATE92763.1 hypothetical protein PhaeoP11_01735 [Phaeobacter gallaeciensis]ATE97415.1 hypothetical protein PhaeoP73_02111 [Phaeobacter gallaeciensis]ATF01428.1 hypothetical protein PhaeoP75_01785 [Phaeobacter gallaeciensis]ATF05808.1 hypothetical protein PhaeoP63_01733 [Phaeobacter gallaeciensis]
MNLMDRRIWPCPHRTKRKRFAALAITNDDTTIKHFPTRLAAALWLKSKREAKA